MWLLSGRCTSKARVDGKTIVITGANTGIGKVTARELVARGGRVILACRDLAKAQDAAEEIRMAVKDAEGAGEVDVIHLDLASLLSVRLCAEQLLNNEPRIDILINNAGIMACPKMLTEDGFEMQLGVNHLAHFLFTCLLLPRIRTSAPARIINVSSLAHIKGTINFEDLNSEKSYSAVVNYTQSKLANVLFSKELTTRLKAAGIDDVTCYALHPGVVATELSRHLNEGVCPGARFVWDYCWRWFIKTPEQGAQTSLHCALDEQAGKETGLYYSDCHTKTPSRLARDPETARRLWEESARMTGMGDFDPITAPDTGIPSKISFDD